jgi:hypothetical protein
MDILGLQQRLAEHDCDVGALDGKAGPKTRAAILKFLTDGPDSPLNEDDFVEAANRLQVPPSYIRAFYEVESSGNPFIDGRPTILFEPHRFSKATSRCFDANYPDVSYPTWDRSRYPRTQRDRYEQLVRAVCLDPLAGFASASYGGFQILGENYARCGARDSMAFAWQESQTVADQLEHLVMFIKSDRRLHDALRRGDWATVARLYNGTGYALNRYDVRLAQSVRRYA